MIDEHLQTDVLDRLERDDALPDTVAHLVLAAMLGQIEECLGGKTMARPAPQAEHDTPPVRAFIESITVEGFRGIGAKAKLSLRAGPGLTLIVGRNGSGKSSCSEALELLLTGENQRWSSGRAKIWKEGWRNLHHPEFTRIEAKLLIDGSAGTHTVSRTWKAGEPLESGAATVLHSSSTSTLSSLGWDEPLATYRPFLSYNELGSMLEEGPSRLYDALASILGLDDLLTAADALKQTRTSRTSVHKAVLAQLDQIRGTLANHSDARAAQCLEALAGKSWDLARVSKLIVGDRSTEPDAETRRLRELASLQGPDVAAVNAAVKTFRSVLSARDAVAATDAGKARRRAEILEKALSFHEHAGDGDCPVCGEPSALNREWRAEAEEEVRKLRSESEAADVASRNLLQAEKTLRQWITAPPKSIADPALTDLWTRWKQAESAAGIDLAAHLESLAPALDQAIQNVRQQAQSDLQKKQDLWQPVAQILAEWLPGARKMQSEREAVASLKSAEDWLRSTALTIHNERFEPIKDRVRRIWELLRTRSHVQLEDVTFQGKSTARRVNLEVTVDGTRGAALGVMSQGELHSLALSLFLPRATLESSPFRFVFIDDPVQSMDPARIDGLAHVLEMVSKKRQVVIFTHDDRLPEAIRRLQIPANIIEVLRRDQSVVELRDVRSPVRQYIDDAFALVSNKDAKQILVDRVVPGLCRQSIEAACIEVVRRRRLQKGRPHDEIESLFAAHTKLLPRLALALYDDAEKAGDVYTGVKNRFGAWQADTVRACNEGAHKGLLDDDPLQFVRNVEQLADGILKL
jgi:ABC-type Mn2+/Zn2+ transport system ATPase subunit